MNNHHEASGWLTSAFLAGVTSSEATTYVEKLISVFVLAMVAELGRRLIARFWKEKK